MNQIGLILKNLRIEKNKTRLYVAKRVGVSYQYYSLIENGVRQPSHRLLERFAECLNISLKDILNKIVEEKTSANKIDEGDKKLLMELINLMIIPESKEVAS